MTQNGVFETDAEIGFAEMNSENNNNNKGYFFNIQACRPILVVPLNAIIYPKKSMIWDL